MLKADLHIHTTASDGVFTPSKVVLRTKEKEMSMIAITDHDCINGIAEARDLGKRLGIEVISGVELSTGGSAETHVLGYGVDENNVRLKAFLHDMQQERKERAVRICDKLAALHMAVDLPQSYMTGEKSLGRPVIARAMMEKGYVFSVQEAFDRHLGAGCPAYVARKKIETAYAIRLLRDIGAVPVLAHPSLIRMQEDELKRCFGNWMDAGLMGVEIYHPDMLPKNRTHWLNIASDHRLLITGGSDFHAPGDKHADIGDMTVEWKNCSEDVLRLLEAVRTAKG